MHQEKSDPTAFQITKEIISSLWDIGNGVYYGAKEVAQEAIEEEAKRRAEEKIESKLKPYRPKIENIQKDSKPPVLVEDEIEVIKDIFKSEYLSIYSEEKRKVKKEAKELALKGAFIIFGLGWLF